MHRFLLLSLFILSCAVGKAQTEAPVIGSFSATPSEIPLGTMVTLSWEVSGATTLTLGPGIGEVSGSTLFLAPVQTTTYTLTATNGAGSTSADVTVTVLTDGGSGDDVAASCEMLNGVQTLGGTLTLTYSGAGEADGTSVSLERAAEVAFVLGKTPHGHWETNLLTGSASIHDTYTTSALNDEIQGSGEPVLPYAMLRFNADCTVSAQVFVSVTAQNSTVFGAATSTVAVIYLEGVALAGSAELETHTWYFGQAGSGVALTQGQDYVEGFAQNLGMMLGHDALGSASVTWSFTPAQ